MVAGVWVLPLVELSGHEVDVVLDEGEGDLAYVEVGSFGQPSAEHAVGVFVGGSLPGRAGVAEVHRRSDPGLDVLPVGHFASLVPGETPHQVGRRSIQGFGYRPCHRSGGAVRDGGQEGVSA